MRQSGNAAATDGSKGRPTLIFLRFELLTSRNQIDLHVGERVRSIRVSRSIDVADLAKIVGVTTDQMKKYESGARRIKASRLQQIAAALEVKITRFFDGVAGASVVAHVPSSTANHKRADNIAPLPADALELHRVFAQVKDAEARRKIIAFAISLAEFERGASA
jgi:transcriptional regulator with XRE-family HTH domain